MPARLYDDEHSARAHGTTKAQFFVKSIDGTAYLFLPWLSGDVTERGMEPSYYVMKKLPGYPIPPYRTAAKAVNRT